MGYDAILAGVIAEELGNTLAGAKIEKIQQPGSDELILQLHCGLGRKKLLISLSANGSRIHFTELPYDNPKEAPNFCMLLRKHIQGGVITAVSHVPDERITYFDIATVNEMGYSTAKRLIAENMGKHSNLILTELSSDKIIDALKRLSIDVNRYRQILPGGIYSAPPENGSDYVAKMKERIISEKKTAVVYMDKEQVVDVYAYELGNYSSLEKKYFDNIHLAMDFFYSHKKETNRQMQKAEALLRSVGSMTDKLLLKKQRLLEDIQRSNGSDIYRLKAELLNANLHLCKPGDKSVKLISYYDGSEVEIALDEKLSAAKNAQAYYKKYAKLKSSAKEKLAQLAMCEKDIDYLNSVSSMISLSSGSEELELIKQELSDESCCSGKNQKWKNKKSKAQPRRFRLSTGNEVLVGRSNSENDYISFKLGQKTDYWFHTKDIHGSHLVLLTGGEKPCADAIYEAAGIAAFYSKAKDSDKVPVDYTALRYVKKPSGAKPGMVIFTHNKTVWVTPKDPAQTK